MLNLHIIFICKLKPIMCIHLLNFFNFFNFLHMFCRSKPIRKTIQVMRKLNRTSSIATTPVKDPLKKSPGMY